MIIGPPKRSNPEPGPKPLNLLLDDDEEEAGEAKDVGEKKEEGEPISRGMGLGTWGGSMALAVLEVEMLRLISAREEAVVA